MCIIKQDALVAANTKFVVNINLCREIYNSWLDVWRGRIGKHKIRPDVQSLIKSGQLVVRGFV